jgi:hypothetical protein
MTYQLVGQQIGWLTVVAHRGTNKKTRRVEWLCKCECGKEKIYITSMLVGSKRASSCHNCEDHINRKDAYISWMSAKSRCLQPTNKDYPEYGGAGITFDPEWAADFKTFYRDMGDPPYDSKGERMTLNRKDNNLGYNKDNCEWADRSTQQRNKRITIW